MAQETVTHSLRHGIIDLIAGTLGGTALVYVGQPFDTIKVKMQTFPYMYKGMVDCFRKTLQTDGLVKGLYAGTLPSVVANVAENSVLFAGYGFCQNIIKTVSNTQTVADLSVFQNAIAGSLAAFGSSLTLCPTELIKCKLQSMKEMEASQPEYLKSEKPLKRIGPMALTQQIIKNEGIRGLFRGLAATILREMPGYFFFFGGYEGTRELLRAAGQHKDDVGLIKTMIAGAVGGAVFWIAIFPADVVKSRMQISNVKRTATEITIQIYKNEGLLALYNGLLPSVIRTIPATATLFVVYEYSKKYMNSFFDDHSTVPKVRDHSTVPEVRDNSTVPEVRDDSTVPEVHDNCSYP